MSGKSPIQWTDASWNPVVGCKRVSAGCDHCYAFQLHDQRHIAWKRGRFPTAPKQYHVPFSQVQLMPERLSDPLHWRKPRRVFVNSMSDLFHEAVPDDFIGQVFTVMAQAKQHTFQVLTKRPERMRDLMRRWYGRFDEQHGSLPNVWLGTSVENQRAANERIPLLLETPAAVRFLSCEPLLGPVNLVGEPDDGAYGPIWYKRAVQTRTDYGTGTEWDVDLQCGIHWVIIGGESGNFARPMEQSWAESLIAQCRAAGIAPFVKQLGTTWARMYHAHDSHGGTMADWPASLRIREFPQAGGE